MIFNKNTQIYADNTLPVKKSVVSLKRDMSKVFGESDRLGGSIRLVNGKEKKECFTLTESEGNLVVSASDELGFIYGIYEISHRFLGIEPFWFWNDQKIEKKEEIIIPDGFTFQSTPFAVKLRGWFINDEVLLHMWKLQGDKDKPWEMAMEALLRLGGNLIIPGTDRNSKKYRPLAAAMGLYITHHHAEPLGAEMFARAYPGLNPSYDEYPEKFEQLWKEGIESQKDYKVIWNLGFRGQGDKPFWEHDPRYDTMEKRGELISKLIRKQYQLVKEICPENICCTNLYGETMELYQKGFLDLPEDIIRIWADNGFGKMVSRRQGNHNPRIPALPEKSDTGENGIYYHVSFYDLQAANHMTALPNNPEFVRQELQKNMDAGADAYWIINSSNIKPHCYYLDFISDFWKNGTIDVAKHREKYVNTYYNGDHAKKIEECIEDYFTAAVSYGPNEDDKAGEQFVNHVARILICQFMKEKSKRAEDLLWACDKNNLLDQISWYKTCCLKGMNSYKKYLKECEQTAVLLEEKNELFFRDSILLQAEIYANCYEGAVLTCRSMEEAFVENYQTAFYLAGKAADCYKKADQAMRNREHGKWRGFYQNECLTDIKQTAWVLETFMGYVRSLGDGPHYFSWQRDFLYSAEDREVILVMNMENHLKDHELFELMKEQLEE